MGTSDPDGDEIAYRWFHYPEAGENPYGGSLSTINADSANASFVMPEIQGDQEIHVILEVKDTGRPALFGYRRVIVRQ